MSKIVLIIPLTRLKRDLHYFNYLVPDELDNKIKRGQLVKIPFRNKKIMGIVFDFGVPEEKKYRLKKIIEIVDPLPFLFTWQLKLAKYLANYYFVSLSVLLKIIVPQIPKKQRAGKDNFFYNINYLKAPKLNIDVAPYLAVNKTVLLRYVSFEKKIKVYLSLIKKMLDNKQQVLIIVPQLSDIKKIYPYFLEHKTVTSVFLNDLAKNKYWQEWLKIKKGQSQIIIGTRSACFAPFKNLGLIIIDQEENENHKQEEPNPRYQVKNVALKLRELTKARLILTSNSPSFSSLYQAQNKNWSYFEVDKIKTPQIKLIDMEDEFRKKNYGIFSEDLMAGLEYSFKRGQKTFLFLNRKGLSTLAVCTDCGYFAACPTCKLPLTLQASKVLVCRHCNYQQNLFLSCPKCHGQNIKLKGTGTEKIEAEMKAKFPLARVVKLDNDSPIENFVTKDYDIIIGTSYAFDLIDWRQISLVAMINADILFYLPDFRSMEKTFSLMVKLASFLNNKEKKLLIQTHSKDSYVYQAFRRIDYKLFYLNELKERKIYHYPPYSKLVRLIYQSIEYNAGEREINQIYNNLKLSLDSSKILISPPLLAYTQQVRGRWRWQIVLKILDKNYSLNFLEKLPENVIIDVDPKNLL